MRAHNETTRRLKLGPVAAASIVAVLPATGCDISDMAFIEDKRVRIVEPADRSSVTLPVTLRWEVEDFTVTGRDNQRAPDSGYLAIFVDRPPIPPGKTLEWFALQDESCGGEPCRSVDNLSNIYTAENTTLELSRLPALRTRGDVERHEVVIVLLDGTGARIGESAFYVRFNFERRA